MGYANDIGTKYVLSDQGGEIILHHLHWPELSVVMKSFWGEPKLSEGSQAMMPLVLPSETADVLEAKLASYISEVAQNGGDGDTSEILRHTIRMAEKLAPQMRINLDTPEEAQVCH